jgi:hypothetical protein
MNDIETPTSTQFVTDHILFIVIPNNKFDDLIVTALILITMTFI